MSARAKLKRTPRAVAGSKWLDCQYCGASCEVDIDVKRVTCGFCVQLRLAERGKDARAQG